MVKVGIITCSDSGSRGEREDISGRIIRDIVKTREYEIVKQVIIPDDREEIMEEMIEIADVLNAELILTTGGTGFSPRDVTPEATRSVIDTETPGIAEAMRYYSLGITRRAMLSRAVAGIRRGKTIIINLPGSSKAVEETLEYIIDSVEHGIDIMLDRDSNCGRK